MSNTIVSIGRNIGSTPMPQSDWDAFRKAVTMVVQGFCRHIWFEASGQGTYMSFPEESFTIIFDGLNGEGPRKTFEGYLADLAATYQQDSIAVTYGTPKFVGAQFS